MSFIVLALTLCTSISCNDYVIDTFAGYESALPRAVSMQTQRHDCEDAKANELLLSTLAARKDGKRSTKARAEYLTRFNITENPNDIDTWDYVCVKMNDGDIP